MYIKGYDMDFRAWLGFRLLPTLTVALDMYDMYCRCQEYNMGTLEK
jgi:hypothetical protein